jgi:hypothetical protein
MAPRNNNNNRWNVNNNNNKPIRFNTSVVLPVEKNSKTPQNTCSEWINKSPHLPEENSSHVWQHKLSLKTRIGPKSFVTSGAKTKKIKWVGGKKTEVCARKRKTRKQRK